MPTLLMVWSLALGVLDPPSLPAEPEALALRWEAPAECPDRARLLATIDAMLGEVPDDERRPLDVRGRVELDPTAGFVLRLELDEGRVGTRELRGASCAELTEAAALVVAMAIDPRLLERRHGPATEHATSHETPAHALVEGPATVSAEPETPATAAPPSEGPAAAASPSEGPAPSPVRRARPRVHGLGRIDAGVGGGPLPGATAALGATVGLGGRGGRAELGASYWTPRTRASIANPAVGVHAQLWTVAVVGCGEPRWRGLSFPLCAGLRAGAVHARGTGALEPRRVASRWVALVVDPGVVWWARPRLGVTLRAEGHVALARPSLRADPSGTVFTSAAVGGALRGGLELRLP